MGLYRSVEIDFGPAYLFWVLIFALNLYSWSAFACVGTTSCFHITKEYAIFCFWKTLRHFWNRLLLLKENNPKPMVLPCYCTKGTANSDNCQGSHFRTYITWRTLCFLNAWSGILVRLLFWSKLKENKNLDFRWRMTSKVMSKLRTNVNNRKASTRWMMLMIQLLRTLL